MKLTAGVDIGNSTTEVCIGAREDSGRLVFLSGAMVPTTGTKGTLPNVHGVKSALVQALEKVHLPMESLDEIRLNEAAPVIGDTAMETITQTIITESSMIGHNPSTPAGAGEAVGELIFLENLGRAQTGKPYLVAASAKFSYAEVAARINARVPELDIRGLILQADEAVLVENRLSRQVPIVDEVRHITQVPEGKPAAIEVALPGTSVRMLSNPYGIATLLQLTPEETAEVTPIARSLTGKRSAVVIKTPHGQVQEEILEAGEITFLGENTRTISIDEGADAIMEALKEAGEIRDIEGQEGTNIGKMLSRIRSGMARVAGENSVSSGQPQAAGESAGGFSQSQTVGEKADGFSQSQAVGENADGFGQSQAPAENAGSFGQSQAGMAAKDIRITDILAVDTLAPVEISGALAGETCMEKAVGIAAMVRTHHLPMQRIADWLENELHVKTEVAGVEAVMASLGALTTPGTTLPLAMLDMGGGSTDAAVLFPDGTVHTTHQAGAGELVSMLIQTELGLLSRHTAEQIKKFPMGKVESLFHMRLENGAMRFFEESIDPRYYGHVVLLPPSGELLKIDEDIPMERILQVRREAKEKVFVRNALRALRAVAPEQDLRRIPNVVLVGGSAEDFEIPEMLMEALAEYRIVCGRGNIRQTEGPRGAVATGLVMAC